MSARERPAPSRALVPVPLAAALLAAGACSRAGVVASTFPIDHAFRANATVAGGPARVWLDTGSTRTIVARPFAERVGLAVTPAPDLTVTDATRTELAVDGVVRIAGLTLGDNTWAPFDAPCITFGVQLPEDAVVGMNVLATAAWCFDPASRTTSLCDGDDANAMVERTGHVVLARTTLGDDAWRPYVTVRLEDSVDVRLLLDTGAAVTCLPRDVVRQLALPSGEELARQRAAAEAAAATVQLQQQGIAGDGAVRVSPPEGWVGAHGVAVQRPLHHLRALDVAGHRVTDLVVAASEHEGVLGRDVLTSVPFVLHGPRRELWLLRRP